MCGSGYTLKKFWAGRDDTIFFYHFLLEYSDLLGKVLNIKDKTEYIPHFTLF